VSRSIIPSSLPLSLQISGCTCSKITCLPTQQQQQQGCKHAGQNNFIFTCMFDLNIETVSFADLDQGCEMIILESILTTFIASVIFRGHWGSSKNLLDLKINPHLANTACLNR
jgi:hypothetical protein